MRSLQGATPCGSQADSDGLRTSALAGVISTEIRAATPIKPDDASALLVIDVQNCFPPGGSLAVKDGEQVVPSSTGSPSVLPMW
jgi:hypothetical protein